MVSGVKGWAGNVRIRMLVGGAVKMSPVSSVMIAIELTPNSGRIPVNTYGLWWAGDIDGHLQIEVEVDAKAVWVYLGFQSSSLHFCLFSIKILEFISQVLRFVIKIDVHMFSESETQ